MRLRNGASGRHRYLCLQCEKVALLRPESVARSNRCAWCGGKLYPNSEAAYQAELYHRRKATGLLGPKED